eukprot:TRINITY_DN28942_c0_g1_i1.p1 TRINITY_DN28942_c0_g1~~TRINITY_DN28942_c0_g1_i1.p1  ORF type:complete len:799 (-),score=166.08 TRINITY_DN28942_c0_g1_i1:50-2446(-)
MDYDSIVPTLPDLKPSASEEKTINGKSSIQLRDVKDKYASLSKSASRPLRRSPIASTTNIFNSDSSTAKESASSLNSSAKTSSASKPPRKESGHTMHPYVERHSYDSLLCHLSDLGLDWCVVQPAGNVLHFSITAATLQSTGGSEIKEASTLSFDFQTPLVLETQVQLANDDEKKSESPKKILGRVKSSGALKQHESGTTSGVMKLKKHIRKLSKGADSPSELSTQDMIICDSHGEVLLRIPLVSTHPPRKNLHGHASSGSSLRASTSAPSSSPSAESSSAMMRCSVEFGKDDCLTIQFQSTHTRDRFARLLRAIQHFVQKNSLQSMDKIGALTPAAVVSNNMICYHQGEIADVSEEKDFKAMLFSDRLILYPVDEQSGPSRVIDLTVTLPADEDEHDNCSFKIPVMLAHGSLKTEYLEFKCLNPLERERWIQAFKYVRLEHKLGQPDLFLTDSQGSEGTPASVQQTLLDQKTFFDFIRYSVHTVNLVGTTEIPPVLQWTEQFGSLRKNKKGYLRTVEEYFGGYHRLMDRIFAMWSCSLLLCDDGCRYSGDENIAFSYPGFESEMFQVSTLATIRPWRLLRVSGRYTSFSLSGWEGTLGARSIGKELMQTYPEVQELYDIGKGADAREITAAAAKEQLHNLMVTQFIKQHRSELFSLSQKEFSWMDVVKCQRRAEGTLDLFSAKTGCKYMFNPSIELLRDHITGRSKVFSIEECIPIWTQLNWLEAMRLVHQERLRYLQGLNACLNSWFEDNGMMNSKPLMFYTKLQATLKEELDGLDLLLDRLPSHEKLLDHYTSYM